MKKAIVASLVLIIGVVLAVPFAAGLIMQKTVAQVFVDVNEIYAATGAGYSLEIIDYDRGYLTSDITWKIDLGPFRKFYHIDQIVFKDHARHGFGGVVATTSLMGNPWYADFVAEKLQARDPLHITTRYGISGSIETATTLDAFSFSVEDRTVDVKAGSVAMATDRHLKHFSASGRWDGLSAGDSLAIGKTTTASKLRMLSTFLWDGDMRFEIQNVHARAPAAAFDLERLEVEYLLATSEDRTTLSGQSRLAIEELHAKDMDVASASVRLAVEGLDTQGYEAFMNLYTQNVARVMDGMASIEEDHEAAREAAKREMAAVGFQMMAAYEKILKRGLELRISDLEVTLAEGEIRGDMTLRLLKDMTLMQFAQIIGQPELLFDIFYLKSDVGLPAGLAGENPKLLEPLYPGMQTGLFVRDGDRLVNHAETVDGRLILNRREVRLPGRGGA